MPFDFGGSFDFGSVDFGSLDVSSVVDDFGSEFLSGDFSTVTDFDVTSFDVAELGGWDQVGSFAGDADWYDAFGGEVLDFADAVEDPFEVARQAVEDYSILPGPTELDVIRELPFADQVKAIASQVSTDFSIFVKNAGDAFQTVQKFSPIINAVSSAFGIPNPISQIIQPISQAAGVAGAVSGVAGAATSGTTQSTLTDPRVLSTLFSVVGATVPGAGNAIRAGVSAYDLAKTTGSTLPPTSTPGTVTTDGTGLVILDAAQTAQLERNLSPVYRSTVLPVDPAESETYTQALQTVESTTTALKEFDEYKTQTTNEILTTSDNIYNINSRLQDPATTAEERAALEDQLTGEYDKLSVAQSALAQTDTAIGLVTDARNQATNIIVSTNSNTVTSAAPVGGTIDQYSMVKNADGTYSVFDKTNNTTVQTGLTEQAAILQIQDLGITAPGITEKTADPVAISGGDLGEIVITASRIPGPDAGITAAETNQARQQQTVRELRNNKAQSGDWRVRLRLAPSSNYLYNAQSPGILSPLKSTDGVIFPYTPSIETAYKANYDPYDLTHSNYRGYFYKGSYVDAVNVRGTFTAQDSKEADYLLAVIHFFRSCTKMFYGSNDQQRGAPPPLVYLNGYGDYQFSEHPCVVSQFNYTLPPDVDYIRAQSTLTNNTNLLNSRIRNTVANNPLAYSVNRLLNSSLSLGALDFRPTQVGTGNLGDSSPTYVPTKMEISITLFPIQSRSQISNNFSVKEFANGNLLKGGYW